MNNKCPYCSSYFKNWTSVSKHTAKCKSSDKSFYIDGFHGPIHISEARNFSSIADFKKKYPYFVGTWSDLKKSFKRKGYDISDLATVLWTKERCIQKIQEFYANNGRIPIDEDFNNLIGYPNSSTVANHCGSWAEAIRLAGFENTKRHKWNKNSCIDSIKRFVLLNGRIPQRREFEGNSDYPSFMTVKKYLADTWNESIKLAGFKPNINNGFGTRAYGKDNILYRSSLEAYFSDNYLFNKCKYEYEKPYQNIPTWKYDFYLPHKDLFIEIHGGLRDERLQEKIDYNRLHNKNFLILYEKDFLPFNEGLLCQLLD